MMTFWDWYWLVTTLFVVIILFGIPEVIAAFIRKPPGDTYSEWWWRHILWPEPGHPLYRYRRIARILFVALLVTLAIHGLSEGRVI